MAVIRDNFQMDPFSNAVFLDNGKFQWPRNASEVRPLTRQEFRWLMEGLSIDQPKAIQPAKGRDF